MYKYLALSIITVALLTGCTPSQPITTGNNDNQTKNYSQPTMTNTAIITTTKGDITVELYGNEAPKAVANFIKL
ncbi:MAG: peptidylprolyl isomerase, partial [Candidatus Komeilibacteria bacterium]